ncbi:MAG TPA: isomerizing glutamine--fructose-6-phosphate transaminase, partial [Candidatus Acidoferrales bacterium]|nr:isomerizing glutamine--fructose-6-phosphate transaminase [Candidatus Acidoferrales bacterium]
MCGIVGYIGPKRVVPLILDGLKRLEYRGYDSAGIAVVGDNGKLEIRRAPGKLRNLEESIRLTPLDGLYGIGHTRWATHGRPTEENAHPHRDCTGEIVVVHNGIIENYVELKNQLLAEGHKFLTETDTEIIAHLVEKFSKDASLEDAVLKTVKVMTGAYAMVVVSAKDPNKIVAARLGPPIVVGLGDQEFFVASDIPAILQHTRSIFFLGDGEMAVLTPQGVRLFDFESHPISRPPQHITWDPIMAEKGGFKHFMQKEIFEQPRAVRDTLLGRISQETGQVFLDKMEISEAEFKKFDDVKIVACGTSWHAGLAGKFMIE